MQDQPKWWNWLHDDEKAELADAEAAKRLRDTIRRRLKARAESRMRAARKQEDGDG